ncbi:hypothetical protein A3709_12725 [Halioglobus sp. HI00S01]|uniref:DUF58 domain-containing protein n=1 Tax=Halioglobus sp. HI00S01 TaxID=1822214 RepID=UPI0007C22C06|nr:DUF58 domain-containing protein [Halioglobus sp. HI00S01]KZX60159.1 hypothetical protein A3709_12725 [Halioglobus sp. HI00S01]
MAGAAGTGSNPGIRARLRQRFREWINRRIPPSRSVVLDQKRLFIFPSGVGFFFGLCLLVMLLAAINFQNNLSYGLTFLLATLFVLAVLHTFANLSGLEIQAIRARPAFPGQQTEFELRVSRTKKREYFGVFFRFEQGSSARLNLVDEDSGSIHLMAPVETRGWHHPGRLRIESTYPLGLVRCWTWIDLDLHALVYPRPLPSAELPGLATDQPDGAVMPVAGSDDFFGFRDYREGDSLRQIHWKGLARGGKVQTKQYTAYADRSVWLDWEMFPGLGTEQRLSHLCYWALEFDRQGQEYGLRLPDLNIAPDVGERHRERILQALALFGIEGGPS